MKVRTQLLTAQLAPLIPLVLAGGIALIALFQMTSGVQDVATVGVERVHLAQETTQFFREERDALETWRTTGDGEALAEAQRRSGSVKGRLELIANGAEADRLNTLITAYESTAGLAGEVTGDETRIRADGDAIVAELQGREGRLREQLQTDLDRVAKTGRTTATLVVVVVGIVLIVGVVMARVLGRELTRAVRELQKGTEGVAAGDFEYRISPLEVDELDQLARAFNKMAGRIAEHDRMKTDFFANISHDLKTPLTSLGEAVDLVDEEIPGPLTDTQRRLVRIMKEDVRRLRTLVTNVLDLSRLESRQPELAPADLSTSVHRIANELEMMLKRQQVNLDVQVPQGLPRVYANTGMLEQVLMNLMSNAVKFSPRGSLVQLGAVDGWEEGGQPAICVWVDDQGPGVPEAHRERIFERFYQVPRAEKRGGSGLGLYICQEIVAAQGGRIWVEEAPSGGARFCFTLAVATENTFTGV